MLRFSLFGFPIAVHWIFWVNIALFGGGISANTPEEVRSLILWMVAAFISIIIHELGHAFLMRRFGARASILLTALGGLAIPTRGFTRVQGILISLAGPLVQIAAGVAAWQLLRLSHGDFQSVLIFLSSFVTVSIYWALLNLAPVYPLDGGQVLNGILGPRAVRATYIIGIVCGVGIAILFFMGGSIFMPILFGMLAYENVKRLRGEPTSSFLHPR